MIGQVLRNRYELVLALGETAVFQSFAARDTQLGGDVCVRILRDPFAKEGEFVTKLGAVVSDLTSFDHANLESYIGVERDGDTPFLVTHYSKGTTLTERLRKLGTLSVPVAVGTVIVICEALQALHLAREAHGDVGSHNVVVSAEGEAKVQLFGVWKSYSASATAGHVVLPQMAPYLAPEIGRGAYPSPTSDVYSVGVLLYELLSGRYPFNADSAIALAMKHANEQAPNVRMMNPSVPVVLAEIIKKAMAKEPEHRYRDAGDLAVDLKVLQDALRFGRTLTWPLRDEPTPVVEQHPVAPAMSAIRAELKTGKEEKRREKREKDPFREEPDVPVWLKVAIAFCAGLFTLIVTLWVVFNMNKPKLIEVPDLTRLSFSEASSRLTELGLKPRIQTRRSDENIPAEQIIAATPGKGAKAFEGSSISLIVSTGSRYVVVPEVKGVTLDRAKAMLQSLNLTVLDEIIEVNESKAQKGAVVGTEPPAGEKVERSSEVRIKMNVGEKNADTGESARKYVYDIEVTLTGLEASVKLKVEMTDARGTRVIHQADHEPDETVQITAVGAGPEVTLKIYYDNELVKTERQVADPGSEEE